MAKGVKKDTVVEATIVVEGPYNCLGVENFKGKDYLKFIAPGMFDRFGNPKRFNLNQEEARSILQHLDAVRQIAGVAAK